MRKTLYKGVVCIGLMMVFSSGIAAETIQKTEKFISVADIHFDPFIECEKQPKPCSFIKALQKKTPQDWDKAFEQSATHTVSHNGQDTNYALLQSTLTALQNINQKEHPRFVLLLGDFLGHNFRDNYINFTGDKSRAGYVAFVKKTLQFLTFEINKVFPTIDIYPAIGNNDTYTADYAVVANGAFLQDTKATWVRFIKNKANQDRFRRDFARVGYYSVMVPNTANERIIVLDTVLFSTKSTGIDSKQSAQMQLQWLRKKLSDAQKNKQKVILAFHIPVDINVSGAFKDNFGVIWKFWQPVYWKELNKILKQYVNTVTVILPAHIHRDIFQFITQGSFTKIPVDFTPAVSPIFGNDPSFKLYDYAVPGFYITRVETYSFALSDNEKQEWKPEYSVHVKHVPVQEGAE